MIDIMKYNKKEFNILNMQILQKRILDINFKTLYSLS